MHRLLKRQIRKYLSTEEQSKLQDFLKVVNDAYNDYDSDLKQNETILDNCSLELFTINHELQKTVHDKTKEVEKTSSKMETLVNNISEVIFQISFSGELMYLNIAWTKITGFSIDSSIGHNVFDFLHSDEVEICKRKLQLLKAGQIQSIVQNIRVLCDDNRYKWCEITIRITNDPDNRDLGFTGTLKNINQRVVLEKEKLKTEEKFKLIFEKSSLAYLIAIDSCAVECNQACLDLFGVSKKENFIGKNVIDFAPEYQPEELLSSEMTKLRIEICKEVGFSKFDFLFKKQDGTHFLAEVTLNPVSLMDQNVLFVTLNDLTERKEVEKELIIAKEKAEEATLAKAQFLSTMSHEIRTPMNAVIGVTHLLSEDNPREDQIQNINILKLSSANLMSLLNDILDFSKIEAGRIQIESIDFNLKHLIQNIASGFAVKSKEKGLEFIVNIDPQIPAYLKGDPTRITQILNNLCGNAIKFTHKGNIQIIIQLQEKHDNSVKLNIDIKDTGVGIPKDKQDQIFHSFSQANSDTTRLYGGTGLGLSISKKLIEIMGGSISVISDQKFGTTFSFNLDFEISHMSKPKSISALENSSANKNLKGLHVLIVEDNRMNILIIKQFLKKWNVTFEVALNGQLALEEVQNKHFDMILMDLQMPVMDGYQATEMIRNLPDEKFKDLPIIAISASAFNEIKKKVFDMGMNDLITKPINPEELYLTIEKHIHS
jgi:PAS domain S-box-containing protein